MYKVIADRQTQWLYRSLHKDKTSLSTTHLGATKHKPPTLSK